MKIRSSVLVTSPSPSPSPLRINPGERSTAPESVSKLSAFRVAIRGLVVAGRMGLDHPYAICAIPESVRAARKTRDNVTFDYGCTLEGDALEQLNRMANAAGADFYKPQFLNSVGGGIEDTAQQALEIVDGLEGVSMSIDDIPLDRQTAEKNERALIAAYPGIVIDFKWGETIDDSVSGGAIKKVRRGQGPVYVPIAQAVEISAKIPKSSPFSERGHFLAALKFGHKYVLKILRKAVKENGA
jgi:hypothetical protein